MASKITVANSNTLKWATALPDGTATGSITVKMAGGGWERPFTGTNLRATARLVRNATGSTCG